MDENRVEMLARQHGIRQKRDDGGIGKTLTAFVCRADGNEAATDRCQPTKKAA